MANQVKIIETAIVDTLVAKVRGVATDAGIVRVQLDYDTSKLTAILIGSDGKESTYDVSVQVRPR